MYTTLPRDFYFHTTIFAKISNKKPPSFANFTIFVHLSTEMITIQYAPQRQKILKWIQHQIIVKYKLTLLKVLWASLGASWSPSTWIKEVFLCSRVHSAWVQKKVNLCEILFRGRIGLGCYWLVTWKVHLNVEKKMGLKAPSCFKRICPKPLFNCTNNRQKKDDTFQIYWSRI